MPQGGQYVDLMRPALAWNSMVVWANGKNIETWLNGIKVTDIVIGSPDYMNRYKLSKFYPGCTDLFGQKNTSGKLVVQDHGGGLRIWMRNNKIRPIIPGGKLASPVITPNGGTFTGTTKVTLDAGITGATIRYTLDGTDPMDTSPIYVDSLGLMISSSTSLKARTFRATFLMSDIVNANFTIGSTGMNTVKPPIMPQWNYASNNQKIYITYPSEVPLLFEIISLEGKVRQKESVTSETKAISLVGLVSGIYWVHLQSENWNQTQKIILP